MNINKFPTDQEIKDACTTEIMQKWPLDIWQAAISWLKSQLQPIEGEGGECIPGAEYHYALSDNANKYGETTRDTWLNVYIKKWEQEGYSEKEIDKMTKGWVSCIGWIKSFIKSPALPQAGAPYTEEDMRMAALNGRGNFDGLPVWFDDGKFKKWLSDYKKQKP